MMAAQAVDPLTDNILAINLNYEPKPKDHEKRIHLTRPKGRPKIKLIHIQTKNYEK